VFLRDVCCESIFHFLVLFLCGACVIAQIEPLLASGALRFRNSTVDPLRYNGLWFWFPCVWHLRVSRARFFHITLDSARTSCYRSTTA
jgi:hypothetical protein